ncbi:MAG: DUF2069 domain-containing protein [Pseudomonadales bacterium]
MPDNTPSQRAFRVCLGLLILLFLLYSFKTLVLWPQPLNNRVLLWLCQLLPIAILLPGILQQRWRSFTWLCFVIQFYFLTAVLAMYKQPRLWLDVVVLCVVVAIFIAALLFIRWRRQEGEA